MTDTIAAVGTAAGPAAIALIRISGPKTFELVQSLLPNDSTLPPPRTATLVEIRDPDTEEVLDQALVTLFPGPQSYTGEDLAELSTHGGWIAPTLVLESCIRAGARLAEEGEFTKRAYLNGKLDLVQAEAILDLVSGRNRALHRAAIHQLERGLSRRLSWLREELIGLEALLVHHLDFPEEDDAPVPLERIVERGHDLIGRLDQLLKTAPEGELLREGALTVLAGRPNSGKSSLFNALIGEERAIVTEIPGTTRDALETAISVGGFPFRIVDTAGLRNTEEVVEKLGIEVAWKYLSGADLVLLCVSSEEGWGEEEERFVQELGDVPVLVLRTKVDLAAKGEESDENLTGSEGRSLAVSVLTGEGLEELKTRLTRLVYRGLVESTAATPVITRARQVRGVEQARDEIAQFVDALGERVPAEMASTHLRSAETALEDVLGVISHDEVLDRLFREFCIGK